MKNSRHTTGNEFEIVVDLANAAQLQKLFREKRELLDVSLAPLKLLSVEVESNEGQDKLSIPWLPWSHTNAEITENPRVLLEIYETISQKEPRRAEEARLWAREVLDRRDVFGELRAVIEEISERPTADAVVLKQHGKHVERDVRSATTQRELVDRRASMDFGQWLVHRGWLQRSDYRELLRDELQRLFRDYYQPGGYQSRSIDELGDDFQSLRTIPFGSLLEGRPDILDRVKERSHKSSVKELVEEWYVWHRNQLEPICKYNLSHYMGEQLYVRQQDKKSVARFLVDAKVDNADTIIRKHDVVVLFEGSSALYAGLAIAASEREVTVHTSNCGIIREYRDNPAVQRGFADLFIIGGKTDPHWCEVDGDDCREQYLKAVSGARETILVIPLSGVTPDHGPTARGPSTAIRGEIVKQGLDNPRLRYVVFIADFAKLAGTEGPVGRPILTRRDEWADVVRKHWQRILIVTTPPPNLQAAHGIAGVYGILDKLYVMNRNLTTLQQEQPFASLGLAFSDEDKQYDNVAKGLCGMGLRFFEVYLPQQGVTQAVRFNMLSPRQIVGKGFLEKLLAQALGQDAVEELNIDEQQEEHSAVFRVTGPAETLDKVHQLRLTPADLRAAFGEDDSGLQSVTVSRIRGDASWEVSSDKSPVDWIDILRADPAIQTTLTE